MASILLLSAGAAAEAYRGGSSYWEPDGDRYTRFHLTLLFDAEEAGLQDVSQGDAVPAPDRLQFSYGPMGPTQGSWNGTSTGWWMEVIAVDPTEGTVALRLMDEDGEPGFRVLFTGEVLQHGVFHLEQRPEWIQMAGGKTIEWWHLVTHETIAPLVSGHQDLGSPSFGVPPIVDCVAGQVCSYSIPFKEDPWASAGVACEHKFRLRPVDYNHPERHRWIGGNSFIWDTRELSGIHEEQWHATQWSLSPMSGACTSGGPGWGGVDILLRVRPAPEEQPVEPLPPQSYLRAGCGVHDVAPGAPFSVPLQATVPSGFEVAWSPSDLPLDGVLTPHSVENGNAHATAAWSHVPAGVHRITVQLDTWNDTRSEERSCSILLRADAAGHLAAPQVTRGREPDADGDGVQDVADNCPAVQNRLQVDSDLDGIGDACAPEAQETEAGVIQQPLRVPDWCTGVDQDRDGTPDACDLDMDGDRIPNADDPCPMQPGTCPAPPSEPANMRQARSEALPSPQAAATTTNWHGAVLSVLAFLGTATVVACIARR